MSVQNILNGNGTGQGPQPPQNNHGSPEAQDDGDAPDPEFWRTQPGPSYGFQENGRWYGNFHQGQCKFPCDEGEKDRLDISHQMFRAARGGTHVLLEIDLVNRPETSPPVRVLDLGTGTGIWAIDMARQLGNRGQVLGVDLVPMQPRDTNLGNVDFRAFFDVEDPWTDLGGDWDCIHARTLNGCIRNWEELYQKIFNHLKPGGYFEQVEIDFIPQGDALRGAIFQQWANDLCHAMDLAGQPIRIDEQTSQKLRNAGFQVQEKTIRLPFSPWPNDQQEHSVGRWMNLVLTFGIEGLTMAPFTRILKRSAEEVSDMVRDVKAEICMLRYHGFCTLRIWSATKPRNTGPGPVAPLPVGPKIGKPAL